MPLPSLIPPAQGRKQDYMVDLSLRLWHALSQPEIFKRHPKIAIFIYG